MYRAKNFIGIIVITILLTACSGDTAKDSTINNDTSEFESGIVNTDALKVRSEAEADAEVLSLLEQGAAIKIIAEEDDFYQIIFESKEDNEDLTGYVKKEYVNRISQ